MVAMTGPKLGSALGGMVMEVSESLTRKGALTRLRPKETLLVGPPRGIPARVLSVRQNTLFTATIKDVEPDFIFVLGTNSVFFWCAASSSVGSR